VEDLKTENHRSQMCISVEAGDLKNWGGWETHGIGPERTKISKWVSKIRGSEAWLQYRTGFDWEDKKQQHNTQLDKRAKNEIVQARSKIIDVQ
jgi:hypothetical protein